MNARAKHYTSGDSYIEMAVPSEQPPEIVSGKFCYVIIEGSKDENGYIPCMAIEGEEWLYPMLGRGNYAQPWYWGMTFKGASEIARKHNERMGISLEREFEIVKASLAASVKRWAAR